MVRTKKYRRVAVVRLCQFERPSSFPFFSGQVQTTATTEGPSSVFANRTIRTSGTEDRPECDNSVTKLGCEGRR
jgi:hypothetical protein